MTIKKKNLVKIFLLLFAIFFSELSLKYSLAVEPDEILQNEKHELRARMISKKIRCMICQNQSIDESNAPLAKDLRILIRSQIKEGKNDKEVYEFLTDRYGDFILLNPPFKTSTILLWIFPFVFFFIAIAILYWHNKNSKKNNKNT